MDEILIDETLMDDFGHLDDVSITLRWILHFICNLSFIKLVFMKYSI